MKDWNERPRGRCYLRRDFGQLQNNRGKVFRSLAAGRQLRMSGNAIVRLMPSYRRTRRSFKVW